MKKYLKILLVLVLAVVLAGCGKKADPNGNIGDGSNTPSKQDEIRHVTCRLEKDDKASGYKLVTDYDLTVEGELVNQNKMKEVITSSNQQNLKYFESYLKTTYETMKNNYGGYTFTVTNDGTQVVAETIVDNTLLNIVKAVQDDASMKAMVNSDNKVTLAGIKSIYKTIGVECNE